MSDFLLGLQLDLEREMKRLETLFEPHCRLTLIVRNPEAKNGDFIFTGDDLDLVIAAIQRLKDHDHRIVDRPDDRL